MKKTCLLAALALVSAASVNAAANDKNDEDKSVAADQKSAAESDQNKKVCRTESVTGSLIAKRRVCMTKAQWNKLAADTKKTLDDYQRNGGAIQRTAGGNGSTAGYQ